MTRLRLIVVLLLVALMLLGGIMYVHYRPKGDDQIPIIAFVLVASVLGSAVNESSKSKASELPANRLDFLVYVTWKLLVAFVLAIVLYFLFMSKSIAGPLFPEFQGLDDDAGKPVPYSNMFDFMTRAKPMHNIDAAKIMVWSFLAGYAERLVPNLIDKVARDRE